MSVVLLLRHGVTAETGSVLTGHTPGVHLDDAGVQQAEAAAARMAVLPLAAIVTSPLDRCVDTAQAVIDAQRAAGRAPAWHVDDRLIECRYGKWTGRPMKDLVKEPMWKVVQTHPSAARFPDGESLAEIAARAVAAVREWDADLGRERGVGGVQPRRCDQGGARRRPGLHLDQFQRIVVDPGVGFGRALHEDASVRAAHERHRRRPGGATCRRPPGDAGAARTTPSGRRRWRWPRLSVQVGRPLTSRR